MRQRNRLLKISTLGYHSYQSTYFANKKDSKTSPEAEVKVMQLSLLIRRRKLSSLLLEEDPSSTLATPKLHIQNLLNEKNMVNRYLPLLFWGYNQLS